MSCCESYTGFRLTATSECSQRSKARIDALFEDSRSVCSSWTGGPVATAELATTTAETLASTADGRAAAGCCSLDEDQQQRRVNSAVQARIEAMFASVEAENGAPGECAAALLPVKYIGSAPVSGRVASVRGLQEPLRQLAERIGESVDAELEVSRRGLTFRTSDLHEENNPFRRIAVWSALRLQSRKQQGAPDVVNGRQSSQETVLHAFVPLVADERSNNNSSSSSNNNNSDDRHAELFRAMGGFAADVDEYPPIFAVVMRRPGAARLLECHAFACRCEEDAVAAAATLYRALLADLDATARRPRQRNGLGCVSLASVASSVRDASPASRPLRCCDRLLIAGTPSLPLPPPPPSPPATPLVATTTTNYQQPVRPPRLKKSSIGSSTNTEDGQSSSSVCLNVNVVVVDGNRSSSSSSSNNSNNSHYNNNNNNNNNNNRSTKRKKKKNLDVKDEDVLEARTWRICSPTRDPGVGEVVSPVRRAAENRTSSSETSVEKRMNAKNRSYGSYGGGQAASSEVQVIENCVYNEQKAKNVEVVNETSNNDHEKSTSGSYGFECCTENSLYESSRIYAKACGSRQQIMSQVHSGRNSRAENGRATSSSTTTTPSSSCGNSGVGSRGKSVNNATRLNEHLRNADEICGLDMHKKLMDNTTPSKLYNLMRPNSRLGTRASQTGTSGQRSVRRLVRVDTMDRPLRPPTRLGAQRPVRQPQQESRATRRRSRAGSEPPATRTEKTVATSTATLLKRSQSDVDIDRGDPLTRVELPRRSSFLKPGSVRKTDGREGGGAGTPLGFTELFDEFRNQEGLTSVDDILAAIIDPEGMSFNELKPLYKEFLLKLASTLTQDELYQRSASIMRRRRRPQRRRSSRGLLRRAIKRSVSRLRSSSSGPTEFHSVIFPARRLNDRSSIGSSSSCDARGLSSAPPALSGLERKQPPQQRPQHRSTGRALAGKLSSSGGSSSRKRGTATRCSSSKSRLGQTTSEDSDTGRRLERGLVVAANRSSSGYVSCSECSYDSESCTCVSADKCYCSLPRRSMAQPEPPPLVCSCDTDSCSESNKCYCARNAIPHTRHHQQQQQQQPSILEQLRQKGIVPSESTLSRGDSPDRSRRSMRANNNLATSKSLEYLQVRSLRGSADNLALDYDLFRPGARRSSQCSSGSEKVLVVSARDPQGRLIYVGGTERTRRDGKHSSKPGQTGKHRRGSTATDGHHEALSIKKSAEIAAVFGARLGRKASSASSLRSSAASLDCLEAGLGYLP